MSWPTVPNSFSPATKARSSEINSNFSAIKDAIASSVTKSNTDYVITDTDGYRVILVSTGNTTRTITLPTAADNSQRIITIKKVDSGTGAVTIDGENSETIDGQLTKSLNVQYDFYELQCDGTNWNIISTSSASSGSGAGSVNYIQTSSKAWDMEATITGWNTYKDAAAATPVDGTGGSPTVITIARNTTTPLNGVADLKISKSAANGQGEGVSIDVTVPSGYQYAQKGQIKLLLNSNTTNFVAGDFVFYVYDVTNSTLITPNVTSMSKYKGAISITWDSSATGTSYRLIMHCAVTTTLAYDIYVDDVIFGPGVTAQGAVVGAWQSYTPTTAGFGTPAATSFFYRRVGTGIEIKGFLDSGTVTGATAKISLPSGLTIDSSAIPGTQKNYLGVATISSSSAQGAFIDLIGTVVAADTSDLTSVFFYFKNGTDASGNALGTALQGSQMLNAGGQITLQFTAPIAEWAGSGTVNIGNNGDEFVYNTDTSNADNTTAFGYGPGGIAFGSYTGGRNKTVRFQTPIQPTDFITIEVNAGTNWMPFYANNAGSLAYTTQNSVNYGMWLSQSSITDVIVGFGHYYSPTGASFGAVGGPWSGLVTWKWRVRKSASGQAVGFGLATATQSGLYQAGAVPGYTGGATIAAGNVGETVTATITTTNPGTSEQDVTGGSITLSPGVWRIVYNASVYYQTGTSSGDQGYILTVITDNSNNHVGNSERILSAFTRAAAAIVQYGTSTAEMIVNINASATYKLRAKRTDSVGTGVAQVTGPSATGSSIFYAVRIQ